MNIKMKEMKTRLLILMILAIIEGAIGQTAYVTNRGGNSVSVINVATNTVSATIPVGNNPYATGNFISQYVSCALSSPIITPSGSTTFCQGDSVTLASSSAAAYLWSNGATMQSIKVYNTGIYDLTITDANGCTAVSSSVLVVVNDLPTPSVSVNGNLALCQGDTVILTSDVANHYTWNNGATTQAIAVTTGGNYYLAVTDNNGCVGTSGITNVMVYPMPNASFTTIDTSGCSPFTVHFTNNSTQATSYHWYFGDLQQSLNFSPTHTYTSQGTYNVKLVATNDTSICPSSTLILNNIINVYPTPSPTITANGPLAFCEGDSILLSTDSAATYVWNSGATTQSIYVLNSGNFNVTVTTTHGCTGVTSTTQVLVYPYPIITATGPLTFCQDDSVTLTCSSDSRYHWNTMDSTQSITVHTSGYYVVNATSLAGCTMDAFALVTVNPLPTPSITSSHVIPLCIGTNDTLTCIPSGTTYLWNNGATANSVFTNSANDYSVTMTDSNGCIGVSDTMHVTTNPLPQPAILSIGATSFCPGTTDTLTCTIAAVSYLWNTGATTQSIAVDTTGLFFVVATDTNGCVGTSTIQNILVFTPPASPVITHVGNNLTTDSANYTYQWFINSLAIAGDTTHTITPTTNGCYSVMETDSNGCTATSTAFCLSTGIGELIANEVFQIYPNPSKGTFTITDLNFTNSAFRIKIINTLGQIILEDNSILATGNFTKEINLSQEPSGIYFMEIIAGGKIFNRKLVLARD